MSYPTCTVYRTLHTCTSWAFLALCVIGVFILDLQVRRLEHRAVSYIPLAQPLRTGGVRIQTQISGPQVHCPSTICATFPVTGSGKKGHWVSRRLPRKQPASLPAKHSSKRGWVPALCLLAHQHLRLPPAVGLCLGTTSSQPLRAKSLGWRQIAVRLIDRISWTPRSQSFTLPFRKIIAIQTLFFYLEDILCDFWIKWQLVKLNMPQPWFWPACSHPSLSSFPGQPLFQSTLLRKETNSKMRLVYEAVSMADETS